MEDTPNKPDPPETVEITDISEFIKLTVRWHRQKLRELEHVLEIPSGTEIEIKTSDTDSIVLTLEGDTLIGFKAGLTVALTALGTLPFVAIPDEGNSNDDSVH